MNNFDLMEENEISVNSNGGTELIKRKMYRGDTIPRKYLEPFQIIFSRVRELHDDKFRIFFCHDLPGDPESEFLKDGGWSKFHRIVFVSHWQKQMYMNHYKIPAHVCRVMLNAIEPFEPHEKPDISNGINLIYTPTPHRGLEILVPVFEKLQEKHDNLTLNVFSSFKLYGWEDRNKSYDAVFARIESNEKIINHGTVTNQELREHLMNNHIFAYPSIWPETSCLCLIDAMCSGLMCVHPDYAALPETALGLTDMYPWDERPSNHAARFYNALDLAIENLKNGSYVSTKSGAAFVGNSLYSWKYRTQQWIQLLQEVIHENPDKSLKNNEVFHLKIGS